jgi:hypothetical protein
MRCYVVRVTRTGDLAHRRRDSLSGCKILVIKAERAKGGNSSALIIKLASVPMLSNQTLYFLPMAGKMTIIPSSKLLPFQEMLAYTTP